MDDMINRQAAIDALDALCDRECKYSKKQRSLMCGSCHLGSAFDVVEQLPSAQQWIPCTERLPKDYDFVLITMQRMNERYNHIPFISVGYIGWNQTAWWCAHDGDCESAEVEVLAWMPLPKPWEGGEA